MDKDAESLSEELDQEKTYWEIQSILKGEEESDSEKIESPFFGSGRRL